MGKASDHLIPYQPGQSGNPKGSPFGSRQRTARLLDTLAEDEAVELFRTCLTAAHGGDVMAMRIVLDRIWPVRKGRPLPLNFPVDLDPLASLHVITRGMAMGEISPEEAQAAAMTVLAQDRLKHPPEPDKPSRIALYLPHNGREAGKVVLEEPPDPTEPEIVEPPPVIAPVPGVLDDAAEDHPLPSHVEKPTFAADPDREARMARFRALAS